MLKSYKDYTISSKKTKQKESLLDNTSISCRSASDKRKGRFWQRIKSFISRMQARRIHGYRFAFLTLSSSPESPGEILHDWSVFKKRIERKFGKIWYFAVREYNEKGDLIHLHLLLYASFIPIFWISGQWNEIHQAKIVYIKAVSNGSRGSMLSYMAKYVSKTIPNPNSSFIRRFSYSLFYRTLAKCWRGFLRYYTSLYKFDIKKIIKSWNAFLLANDEWSYAILYKFIKSLG